MTSEFVNLTQSIFLETFGDPTSKSLRWTQAPLAHLLSKIDSGSSPVCLDRTIRDGEWGVLRLGAVTKCEYAPGENKALPPNIQYDPQLEIFQGDLLFTRKNTANLVAACALVKRTPPRLLLPDLIFRLRLNPDAQLLPEYLHQVLIHPRKRRDIQSLAGGSAGSMPNISKAKLLTVKVPVPPISLQLKFVGSLQRVDALESTSMLGQTKTDSLFVSLQHRAFRGEL